MADNPTYQSATVATLPAGTVVAADDVSVDGTQPTAAVQFMKLVDGTPNGTKSVAAMTSAPTGTEGGLVVRNIPSGTQPVSGSVTVTGSLPAGTNNIGDVDVLTLPSLPAGGNVIGAVTQSGSWTADTELPAAAALADATGNPTAPAVAAFLELFNGTTWDRARGDIANGLDVDVTRVSGTVTTKETRSATATPANFTGSGASQSLIAANTNRLGATVYNDSGVVCYLHFGAAASSTTFTVKMVDQSYYEVPFGYTGAVNALWASGAVRVVELT